MSDFKAREVKKALAEHLKNPALFGGGNCPDSKITKSANSQIAGLMRASANRLSIFANTMTRRMKDEAFGKRKILTTLQFLS
jgi:hypothetical protein